MFMVGLLYLSLLHSFTLTVGFSLFPSLFLLPHGWVVHCFSRPHVALYKIYTSVILSVCTFCSRFGFAPTVPSLPAQCIISISCLWVCLLWLLPFYLSFCCEWPVFSIHSQPPSAHVVCWHRGEGCASQHSVLAVSSVGLACSL
jgi:hypothetical protein